MGRKERETGDNAEKQDDRSKTGLLKPSIITAVRLTPYGGAIAS